MSDTTTTESNGTATTTDRGWLAAEAGLARLRAEKDGRLRDSIVLAALAGLAFSAQPAPAPAAEEKPRRGRPRKEDGQAKIPGMEGGGGSST